jgi:hypothetical protein
MSSEQRREYTCALRAPRCRMQRAPARPSPSCSWERCPRIGLISTPSPSPSREIQPQASERCLTPAQGRYADAAGAVARIETVPAPCDAEWSSSATPRALLALHEGDHERAVREARSAVAAADRTDLIVFRADAYRTLAAALRTTDNAHQATTAAHHALALDEAKEARSQRPGHGARSRAGMIWP